MRVMHLVTQWIRWVWDVRMVLEVVTVRNIGVLVIILTGVRNHFRR